MRGDGSLDEAVGSSNEKGNKRKKKKEHLKAIKGNELFIALRGTITTLNDGLIET